MNIWHDIAKERIKKDDFVGIEDIILLTMGLFQGHTQVMEIH